MKNKRDWRNRRRLCADGPVLHARSSCRRTKGIGAIIWCHVLLEVESEYTNLEVEIHGVTRKTPWVRKGNIYRKRGFISHKSGMNRETEFMSPIPPRRWEVRDASRGVPCFDYHRQRTGQGGTISNEPRNAFTVRHTHDVLPQLIAKQGDQL